MTLIHKELSYEILGALFDVFNEIGYGHKEQVYQRAVSKVLSQKNIPFKEQVKGDLKMGEEKVGVYFFDFLIDEKVILELKSRSNFRSADFRQAISYLKSSGLKLYQR